MAKPKNIGELYGTPMKGRGKAAKNKTPAEVYKRSGAKPSPKNSPGKRFLKVIS